MNRVPPAQGAREQQQQHEHHNKQQLRVSCSRVVSNCLAARIAGCQAAVLCCQAASGIAASTAPSTAACALATAAAAVTAAPRLPDTWLCLPAWNACLHATVRSYCCYSCCCSPIIRIFFGSTEQLTDTRTALLVLAWRTPCVQENSTQQVSVAGACEVARTLQVQGCVTVTAVECASEPTGG